MQKTKKDVTFAAFPSGRKRLIHKKMKKSLLHLLLLALPLSVFLSACDNNKNVVIHDNGTPSNGSRVVAIDRNHFYLDGIQYTVVDGYLEVSGYDSLGIANKEAKIATFAQYLGSVYKVLKIGDYAFYFCPAKTVTIPSSVTSIGEGAFYECIALTSITIPNSVTYIEGGAFYECNELEIISVAPGNATYDSRENCNAIIETSSNTLIAGCKRTTIPNSVTSIGDAAFCNCCSLTSITIPNSVTSIERGAFSNCIALTSITIPNSVTSIGRDAFWNCLSLNSIHFRSTTPPYTKFVTDVDTYERATLYVPKGCRSAYKAADGWQWFTHIEEEE